MDKRHMADKIITALDKAGWMHVDDPGRPITLPERETVKRIIDFALSTVPTPDTSSALAWWKSYWDRNDDQDAEDRPTDEDIAFALERFAAREWIPVNERLPVEDGEYLCTMDVGVRAIVRFYASQGRWNISTYKPTHWQPLPAAAEASDEFKGAAICGTKSGSTLVEGPVVAGDAFKDGKDDVAYISAPICYDCKRPIIGEATYTVAPAELTHVVVVCSSCYHGKG